MSSNLNLLNKLKGRISNRKDWKIVSLESVLKLITYGLTVRPKYHPQGIPLISAAQIRKGFVDFENVPRISINDYEKLSDKCKVSKGDILFAKTGSIGHCAVCHSKENIAIAQNVARLVFDHQQVLSEFALHYLRTPFIQNLAKRNAKGNAVQDLQLGEIKKFPIPLPPLEEQRRIAAILDKADTVRRKREKAIRLTEELLRSLFLDMFGDPVTNPKGWEIRKLEDVTTKITDGVHFRPTYTQTGIPFVSVKDITTGKLKFDNCKFISEEDHQKYIKRCKPEFEDILYTKVGATYGRPALVDVRDEFSIYVSVCLLKPIRSLVLPQFLREVLATSAVKRQADKSIKGIGVPDLHLNMIKKFIVPVPDLKIQDQFLKKTENIHKIQSTLELQLIELNLLFNSLLQKAFQGEL